MDKSAVSIVGKMIVEAEREETLAPILASKTKSSDPLVFGLLTLSYIVCELIYNRWLLQVASETSSLSTLDWVERTGRTMAGVGLALVLWRIHSQKLGYKKASFDWRAFSFCVVFSIPSMWIAQELFIRSLVSIATPESLKSASVAAMAMKMSFSPTSVLDGFSLLNKEEKNEKSNADISCQKKLPYFLNEDNKSESNKVNKAVFSALSLNDGRKRKMLGEFIISQSDCALEKTPLTIKRMHDLYSEKTESLKNLKSDYFSASEKLINYQKSRWASKSKAESMWRQGVNKFFGFETTIPWGLSSDQFDKHIDVAKMVGKQAGFDFPMPLGLNFIDFKLALKKAPSFLVDSPESSFKERGYFRKNSELSYKSAIVPVIGFLLSLFFGVFNLFMLLYNLIFDLFKLKKNKIIPFVFLLLLSFFPIFAGFKNVSFSQAAWENHPFLSLSLSWVIPSELLVENFFK